MKTNNRNVGRLQYYERLRLFFLVIVFLVFATPLVADPAGTDTGESEISVTINDLVEIFMQTPNITVNPFTPGSDIDEVKDVCIYTNNADGQYRVTATGSGAADAFTILEDGAGNATIEYAVTWYDDENATGDSQVMVATTTYNRSGATNDYPCDPATSANASFRVVIENNDILSVPAGTYDGTLTFTVAPGHT